MQRRPKVKKTQVKYLQPCDSYNKGEIAGWPPPVAAALVKRGVVEYYPKRPKPEPEAQPKPEAKPDPAEKLATLRGSTLARLGVTKDESGEEKPKPKRKPRKRVPKPSDSSE